MDLEAANIKPGLFKQKDREVHIPARIFDNSPGFFVCGCFLGSGKDKLTCVVLRCSVQNGA